MMQEPGRGSSICRRTLSPRGAGCCRQGGLSGVWVCGWRGLSRIYSMHGGRTTAETRRDAEEEVLGHLSDPSLNSEFAGLGPGTLALRSFASLRFFSRLHHCLAAAEREASRFSGPRASGVERRRCSWRVTTRGSARFRCGQKYSGNLTVQLVVCAPHARAIGGCQWLTHARPDDGPLSARVGRGSS